MRAIEKNKTKSIPAVSVIIPVYNAEKYLQQMLKSVAGQTLRNIEIICVNDGSTDDSASIIRRFMKKDPRIRLIEQENLNAGVARNNGLKEARGKYVVFWDADDKFHKKAAELLYRRAEKMQADVCICGVYEFTDNGKVYEADGYLKTEMLPDKESFNKYDISECLFNFATNVMWNKMFLREFLIKKGIVCQDIRQANDTAFVMLSMYLAEVITCVEKKLVYYRVNNEESLTGKSSETVFCPYQSYLYTLERLKKYPDFAVVEKSFRNKAVRGMFRSLNIQTSFEAYEHLYRFLKEKGLETLGIHQCKREEMEQEWFYRDLELMKEISAGEFLLHKTRERLWERDCLKYTLRRVRRRLAVLLALNQKLKRIASFFKETDI